jgi:hypothetical protein
MAEKNGTQNDNSEPCHLKYSEAKISLLKAGQK